MKELAAGRKTGIRVRFVKIRSFIFCLLIFIACPKSGLPAIWGNEYAVFEVMEEVGRLEILPLWPNFDPRSVPTALFDGKNTYLFNSPRKPEGFRLFGDRTDVLIYDGRHMSVFGNRRMIIQDIWVATSVLQANSTATGRPYTLREMAAIIIHEQFHVFQAIRHPDWLPNDAVLLDYPLDTVESLALRKAEVEAFRRAVTAEDAKDSAGWAAEALKIHRERLSGLPAKHALYERELQRLEGTAEYIEYLAGGRGVMDGPRVTERAPRAIRELGYQEGRWIASLLDRLDPGWKDSLEGGEYEYPEYRLEKKVRELAETRSFTADETRGMALEAAESLQKMGEERKALAKNVKATLSNKIEIVANKRPLRLENFDPFTIEALNEREIVHKQWLVLKNERGGVEVFRQTCLTEINEDSQIVRLVIPGLLSKIRAVRSGNKIIIKMDGITAVFQDAKLSVRGKKVVIKLE
jgi:hypothetical protein